MVRIAANGDILPDAPPTTPSQRPQPQQGYGSIRHDEGAGGQGMANNGMGSVFDNLNNRLLDAGIPRWNAGPYVVEPIVSLGFVLAGFLIGWHGLLFAGLLFFISKYSGSMGPSAINTQGPRPGGGRGPGGRGGRGGGGGGGGAGGGGGGGGHRLGR